MSDQQPPPGADAATIVIGIALTVWLLRQRRWAELTFVGLQVALVMTTPSWQHLPRYALAWWPLWILLAQLSLRRSTVLHAILVVCPPMAITFALMFSTGRWAG